MPTLVVVFVVVLTLAIVPSTAAVQQTDIDLQSVVDDAAPGSTIDLASGTYIGGITINKPLTLRGHGWPVIDGGGSGSVIEVKSPDVTIENLVIRSSGASVDREDTGVSVFAPRVTIRNNKLEDVLFGMFLRAAPDSVISGNVIGAKDVYIANRGDGIRLWESARSVVENNTVVGGRDTVFWFSDNVVVRNNDISNGRYGLHFMYSDGATIEGNVLSSNSVGLFMMYSRDTVIRNNVMAASYGPSGYGIGLKDMDDFVIAGNRLVANRTGIYLDNSPSSVNSEGWIENNLVAYNQVGVLFLPNVKRNNLTENTFIDNTEQVGITSSGTFSGNRWSVDGRGNFWSDYAGYDADGDGIGDVSYQVDDLYNTLTDRYPELEFFNETPASKVIGLAAQIFPVLRPEPIIRDDNPLIRRPDLAPVRNVNPDTNSRLLIASILMLAGAITLGYLPSRRRQRTVDRRLA